MDKVSYYIGHNFGKQMNGQPFTLNMAELMEGIKHGATGEKAKYAENEAQEVMMKFQTALQAADAKRAEKDASAGKDFMAANGKKQGVTTTASGLQYEVMKAGDGPKPAATDTVKVHYHGTLVNGKVFDSSVERGEPIEFALNQVIKGWTEGVQLMPKGSKYKFTIPAELAYGPSGQGSIPPNSVLIFEVELLDFKAN
ncbi:MAG: FKBP-type peptidyl-prolyl cis-trans isomerase [Verrucomicrobiaceae bacterium]|nr:FKBP-type peptidyl-prolyl cis-trans isomerase [Verrucomicrobiaceae bacterium]